MTGWVMGSCSSVIIWLHNTLQIHTQINAAKLYLSLSSKICVYIYFNFKVENLQNKRIDSVASIFRDNMSRAGDLCNTMCSKYADCLINFSKNNTPQKRMNEAPFLKTTFPRAPWELAELSFMAVKVLPSATCCTWASVRPKPKKVEIWQTPSLKSCRTGTRNSDCF